MMNKSKTIPKELIAPCGMNCAICSRYLSYVNRLARSQCIGCRPRNQECIYLFGKCTEINHASKGDAAFCFECSQYPCKELLRVDKRYRNNYKMSILDNLERIRKRGIDRFIKEQWEQYQCPKCGGVLSIHNRKCFSCEPITRLVEKNNRKYND